MTILRPYQAAGCDWIEASWSRLPTIGRRPAVVYQLPTGGGKTPMQAALVERAHARGWTAAVMAPGIDLCRQLRPRVGCDVHLTTTLAAHHKAGKPLPSADVWLVDEARCITSAGVSPVVLALQAGGARMAFFDATPETAQGMGLAAWADDLRQGPSVRELVAAGHLVPSRVFSAEQGKGLARAPIDVWLELSALGRVLRDGERWPGQRPEGRSRRALVFARDKAHARAIVSDFEAHRVPAAFIGDDTKEDERRRLLGWTDAHGTFHEGALARGEVWALVCASLLRQGIDIPEIELVISARAFDSEPLARQAWGRGMRVCPEIGKRDCVMVDLVGGIVDRVGLPDDERVWSLDGAACRGPAEALPPCVQCENCHQWGRGGACMFCGFALPPPPPPPVLARDLAEVFAKDRPEVKAETLVRYVREAYREARAKVEIEAVELRAIAAQARTGRMFEIELHAMVETAANKGAWSGAYRWGGKYRDEQKKPLKPKPKDVLAAIRAARLEFDQKEGENMSRTKSTGLIKAAVRPRSDAGHAGWRPKVDMAASMQINGLRPAAPVDVKPIEPVRMTAAEAREICEDHERTERIDPQETPRRMTQPGLFDALGVKV